MDETTDRGSEGRGVGCESETAGAGSPTSAREWLRRYCEVTRLGSSPEEEALPVECRVLACISILSTAETEIYLRAERARTERLHPMPPKLREALSCLCEAWLALERERVS